MHGYNYAKGSCYQRPTIPMEAKNHYQMFNVTEPFITLLAHGLKQSGYVQLRSYISTDEHQLALETSHGNRRPVDFSSCLHYFIDKANE